MTVLYFTVALLSIAGAAVLLWLDRRTATAGADADAPPRGVGAPDVSAAPRSAKPPKAGRGRSSGGPRRTWSDGHGFGFLDVDPDLRGRFVRAGLDESGDLDAVDVSSGTFYGEDLFVFDCGEQTVVAIKRSVSSSVVIDLRVEDAFAPSEEDVDLVGALASRVMFSTHVDVARRITDRRMIAFAKEAPPFLEVIWNEGPWSLAAMPRTTDPATLDAALEAVRRFTDLLRVLPPDTVPEPIGPRDPSQPGPQQRRSRAVQAPSVRGADLATETINMPRYEDEPTRDRRDEENR